MVSDYFSFSLPVTLLFSSLSPFNSRNAVINLKSVQRNLYLSDLQTSNDLNVLPKAVEQPVPNFSFLLWTKTASCCVVAVP